MRSEPDENKALCATGLSAGSTAAIGSLGRYVFAVRISKEVGRGAIQPGAYGPAVIGLLAKAPLNELGPGKPVESMREALAALTPKSLVAPEDVTDPNMAACCCAGLWLRFDFLDESHHVSQSIDTPDGSFWHGIMHRREPDFANAKYWFRRTGEHPLFARLAEAARDLAADAKADRDTAFLLQQAQWDPLRFVDLCEIGLDGSPPLHTLCMRIQQREWELLFDHCYRAAYAE